MVTTCIVKLTQYYLGDPIFEETALKSVYGIWERRSPLGLPGNHIDVVTGKWKAHDFSIGNFIDSYLEYLVKGGALLGRGELIDMFRGNVNFV